MKRITIPNYLPTLAKGVHSDLEVTYTIDGDYTEQRIVIDEVFCYDGNITELLTETAKNDLAKEVAAILQKERVDAQIALRVGL